MHAEKALYRFNLALSRWRFFLSLNCRHCGRERNINEMTKITSKNGLNSRHTCRSNIYVIESIWLVKMIIISRSLSFHFGLNKINDIFLRLPYFACFYLYKSLHLFAFSSNKMPFHTVAMCIFNSDYCIRYTHVYLYIGVVFTLISNFLYYAVRNRLLKHKKNIKL